MVRKLLEVREFDKISCNHDYKTEYAYLPEDAFRDLEQFIHVFSADENHADALEFMKIGYRRYVGDTITLSNYVGLIQMDNGWQIQILPKINLSNPQETKQVFLRMLRSMKDFPSKVFNNADLKTADMSLYEIFISIYLQEVEKLVKRGIRSSYVTMENNGNYYKGKLLFEKQIARNLGHEERFYVQYDEYHQDRSENRLIKSTLLKLKHLTDSAENSKRIKQLLNCFEAVEPSYNYDKDFARVVIDRNSKDYETLMRWSRVFLQDQSFTTFSGKCNARALLFPMEKVFESYIAQQMKKEYEQDGWRVKAQDHRYYLFDSPRNQFALRPDIVIERNDGHTIILDTKWKVLNDNPRSNYGISQADMYQMYAYSKKYGTPDIFLLYPMNQSINRHELTYFRSKDGVNVNIFFIDVARIENSLNELKEALCR